MVDYQASGGTSRVYELASDEHLQIEAHPESYSVLWSTELSIAAVSERLILLLPRTGRRVIIHRPRQDSHETLVLSEADTETFLTQLLDRTESADFVRVDFEDRVLTWELSEAPEQRFNEIGFLAQQFDPSYLVSLIGATATFSVAARAEEAIYRSADIVDRFPRANLFPDEPSPPNVPLPPEEPLT